MILTKIKTRLFFLGLPTYNFDKRLMKKNGLNKIEIERTILNESKVTRLN